MKKFLVIIILFFTVSANAALSEGGALPTYADLVVYVAKFYFRNAVPVDASVGQCFYFLNSKGVCVSLFDLMDPCADVTNEDFARAIGQATLVFLGEDHIVDGCVQIPGKIESWVDYCVLNDIDCLRDQIKFFLYVWNEGSFPEVWRFYEDHEFLE